jgi:signal transduction histidine kinase
MTGLAQQIEERVLILAPIGRDARAAAQSLTDIELGCTICTDIADLHERLCEGAAVAVATEEAFVRGNAQIVEQWVAEQPPWSDFPFVVLTGRASSATAHGYRLRLLERLGNVSLLERPLNAVTLVSTVKAALRARYRQYEVRDHLFERDLSAAKLENLVRERTVQLEQANDQLREQIAERKQAEAALQQAQKMEVIGQMTGGVAHDFNNLLTAVLGNLELASRRGQDPGIKRYLDGAMQAAQRGAKITSQLLAFSRTQRLQTEPIDINDVVTRMGDLLFRSIGGTVRIETILDRNLWRAVADAGQIELIILNLAINARDAMKEGGRVTISTANVPEGQATRSAELPPGDYVSFSLSDTGTGMTDEVLRKAFEPFFTTKPVGSGTGLGLSQVYGISKQSGGGVSIATKVGEGTTVTVYLPRTTSKPVLRTVESRDEAPLTGHRATILVVDDDRDVRELATSCLETLGYHVLEAEGGRAAIDLICSETAVDLVLIDVAMPDINGVETIRAVRKRRPDLRFLYITGYVGATPLDPSEKRVLNKPFTLAGLAAKVEEALFPANMTRRSSNVFSINPARPKQA